MSDSRVQVILRDRAHDDAESVAEIASKSLQQQHARDFANIRPAPSIGQLRADFAELGSQPDRYFRVAEIDGRVVGFLTAALRPAPAGGIERFDGPLVYVSDVAVTGDARRRGVARILVGDIEAWGRKHGPCAITLSMRTGNPDCAR